MRKLVILLLFATSLFCFSQESSKLQNGLSKSPQEKVDKQNLTKLSPKTISLKASSKLLKLWHKWHGKYALYAHRSAGIQSLKDLDGKKWYISIIDVSMSEAINDASSFADTAGIQMQLGVQNNPKVYPMQIMEDINYIGLITPSMAEKLSLNKNNDLVNIILK